MRVCKWCKIEKPLEDFYLIKRKSGKLDRDCTCSECRRVKNREYSKKPDVVQSRRLKYTQNRKNPEYVDRAKKYLLDYYNSPQGRAKTLLKSVIKRSKTDRFCYTDITEDFIIERLKGGKCEVTGIEFEYENTHGTFKNPFSPSIDRIDSSKGYTVDNVRFVIWQINLMKGELTDDQFIEVFKRFYESLKGGVPVG